MVVVLQVGYTGGYTRNPKYEEVCSGTTGHTEVVRVVFDPQQVAYQDLLVLFWENHDPTMGMRQGYDMGTQYRSGEYSNYVRYTFCANKMTSKVGGASYLMVFFSLYLTKTKNPDFSGGYLW